MAGMLDTIDWRCFLALESDFVDTFNTVEFNEDNYTTYSIRYRSIILQACSEVEKFCKNICGIPQDHRSDMGEYRKYIKQNHEGFHGVQVSIPSHSLAATPWSEFKDDASPEFWLAYRAIKHEGDLVQANFYNALQSLAGHFSIMVAWYCKSMGNRFSRKDSFSEPRLFTINNLKSANLVLETGSILIPGFTEASSPR